MPGFKSPHGAAMDYKDGPKPEMTKVTKAGHGDLISNLPSPTGGGVDKGVVSQGPRSGSLIEVAGKKGTGDSGLEKMSGDFSLIKSMPNNK